MFSRTKVENIFGLLFNTINLCLYLVAMATSLMKAIVQHTDVSQILTCIYAFLLSASMIIIELNVMDSVLYNFRFFTRYRGRSVILLLLGSIIFSLSDLILLVVAVTLFSFGCIYMILSFIPTVFSAKPVVENWQNWQEYSAEGLDLDRPMNSNNSIDNAARLKLSMIERPPSCVVKPV